MKEAVSAPIILGPLGELRNRPFAFYPAIAGIEHNEWRLRRATWTEVQVVNTKTGTEVWVPRRVVGGVSSVEAPVVIVGLVKELEYKEGALVAQHQRLIEMPRAVNGAAHALPAASRKPTRLAPVIAIRTETPAPSPARRWLRGSLAAGVLACISTGFLLRDFQPGIRSGLFRSGARQVRLTANDDYRSIVQKLGRPYSDQWLQTSSGLEYRRLWYPRRSITIVLTGGRYAGALTSAGAILHAALPDVLDEISAPGLGAISQSRQER
jgi:hypothetical protein